MDRAEFAARIDHTVLGPETTWADVETVLDAALEHGMNACVPPAYVERAAAYVPTVTVVTVCGFPHGQAAPETKAFEAEHAWRDGAEEVDVVVNVGRLHAGETDAVTEELEGVVASVPLPVKVIVEAPLLAEDDLRTACELAEAAGADFVKTATGFSIGGATVEDVRVMAEYLPVKASGGVGSFEEAVEFLEAGAARIGASAGVEIVEGFDPERLDEFDPERLDEFDPERPDEFDPEHPEAHDDEHLETEWAPGAAEADDHDREEDDSSRAGADQ